MHNSRFFVGKKDKIIRLFYSLSWSLFCDNEDDFNENLEIK